MSDAAVTAEATQPEVAAAPVESVDQSAPAPSKEEETATAEPAKESEEKKDEQNGAAATEATEATEAKNDTSKAMLKTTGTIDRNTRANLSKFDPNVLPETDDPVQIRGQVEFYFSDSNLGQDEFLWNLTGGPQNLPVKVKKICSFKRMRRFQPYSAVITALKESSFLSISGEDGEEEITRKVAYDTNRPRNKTEAASIYVKGFGDEEPSTQFDIEAFFTKFGAVNSVRLRRTPENFFKGSVFVEFQDEENAKKFLEMDPAPQWKGHELKIMTKRAYVDEKTQLIKEGKLQPSESKPRFFEGKISNSRGRGRGGRGGGDFKGRNFDKDDWKTRRDNDRKNGFRDNRGGRARGGRGGRGGFGRDGRDSRRDRDRDGDRSDRRRDDVKPTIQATNDKGEAVTETTNKRSRDEDGGAEDRPAKKVDAKPEVAAEAS